MQLTKHHGLGNDFLVCLDPGVAPDADLARSVCDRRFGVGADGLLHGLAPEGDADLRMVLLNADGSRAEMSGNGIRCLAQAEAMRRGTDTIDLRVETDAGLKVVAVRPGGDGRTIVGSVDMGAAQPLDPPSDAGAALKVAGVGMGNPHAVRLYDDRAPLDADADALQAGAANVELVVAGPEADAVTMRVVERGVGETLACGTGACAAAWAAREWGLVGDRVVVHMPGGDAVVDLGDTITLTGPAVFVATVELPWR